MSSLLMGTWTDHVIITHGGMPSRNTEEDGTSQVFHTAGRAAAANGSNRLAMGVHSRISTRLPELAASAVEVRQLGWQPDMRYTGKRGRQLDY